MLINPNQIHWSLFSTTENPFFIGNIFQTAPIYNSVTYYLNIDSGVCKSNTNALHVFVKSDCDNDLIANFFTPNGDGINDFFPGISGFKNLTIEIFNRWGKIIYNQSNNISGWDGNNDEQVAAPEGTYYYVLKANYLDDKILNKKGYITLVR